MISMKKMLGLSLVLAAVMSLTAGAEAIWSIQSEAGYFHARGVYTGQGAKAEFGVWPVAAGHSAGAVFTYDGWNTVMWNNANWCENVTGPYGNIDEHWVVGMYISAEETGGDPGNLTIEYALYVDDSTGNRYWDNNGGYNYSITVSYALPGSGGILYACF